MPVWEPEALGRLLIEGGLLGLALAASYEILRILRILVGERRGSGTARNLTDLLWCIAAGAAVAIYLSTANNGRLRWPVPLGLALGMLAWRATLGRLLTCLADLAAPVVARLVQWLLYPLVCLADGIRRMLIAPISARIAMWRLEGRLSRAFRKFEKEG